MASSPRARNAALYIVGESEWAIGSPITPSSLVLALISTLGLRDDALHRGRDERLELGAGVAVDVEVPTKRVAHLGLVTLPPGVLAQHEHVSFATELVHARAVMTRHRENQVGRVHHLAGEQLRAVAREIEPPLEPHQVGAFRHRRTVPRARPRRGHVDRGEPALLEGALQQRGRERAAADVTGADEQDRLHSRFTEPTGPRRGADPPASARLRAPGGASGVCSQPRSTAASSPGPRHPTPLVYLLRPAPRSRAGSLPARGPEAGRAGWPTSRCSAPPARRR